MGRSAYTVDPAAIDSYILKVRPRIQIPKRQIDHRIMNAAQLADPNSKGMDLYPAVFRNGREKSYFLVPNPKNRKRIADLITVEEARELGYI